MAEEIKKIVKTKAGVAAVETVEEVEVEETEAVAAAEGTMAITTKIKIKKIINKVLFIAYIQIGYCKTLKYSQTVIYLNYFFNYFINLSKDKIK